MSIRAVVALVVTLLVFVFVVVLVVLVVVAVVVVFCLLLLWLLWLLLLWLLCQPSFFCIFAGCLLCVAAIVDDMNQFVVDVVVVLAVTPAALLTSEGIVLGTCFGSNCSPCPHTCSRDCLSRCFCCSCFPFDM